MITIENFSININTDSLGSNEHKDTLNPLLVRDELVNLLRIISEDKRFIGQTVVIPDNCEEYGFAEGEFNLPKLLHFLADMLE